MGTKKTNKKSNTKKSEVAKNNKQVVSDENVEQVEQVAVSEPTEQPNKEPVAESANELKRPHFTKKNGETERKVLGICYELDVVSRFFVKSEDFTEEQKSDALSALNEIRDTLKAATADKIAEENAVIEKEISEKRSAKGKELSDKKKFDKAVKVLVECGMSEDEAASVVKKKMAEEAAKKSAE